MEIITKTPATGRLNSSSPNLQNVPIPLSPAAREVVNKFLGFDNREWPIKRGNYANFVIYGKQTRVVHRMRVTGILDKPRSMQEFLSHYRITGFEVGKDGVAVNSNGTKIRIEEDK